MIRRLLLLLFIITLSGCDNRSSAHSHKQQMYVFGTLVEVVIWSDNEAAAQQAIAQLGQQFQTMHQQWHPWKTGDLSQFNQQLKMGDPVIVPESIKPLLDRSMQLAASSQGLFDPSIGELVKLWGFSDNLINATQPPDTTLLNQYLQHAPQINDLHYVGDKLQSNNPQLHLDFGGFAKGYAVDLAIDSLREMGFENAIVNAGGDLRAIGSKGEWQWNIGIRDPRGSGLIASIKINNDESVFTSGDYERFFDYQGKRYHHIIDPRSGYPATGFSSVTILHHDAADADAAATAILVAGPSEWKKIAQNMGITHLMVITDQGKISMTQAMAPRIKFEVSPKPQVHIESW